MSTPEVDIQCRRNALPAAPVLGLIEISFASVVVTIAAVKVFLIQQIIIRIDPRSRHCISDREAGRKLKIGIIADSTCQLAANAERTEGRRGGHEWVSTLRTRGAPS